MKQRVNALSHVRPILLFALLFVAAARALPQTAQQAVPANSGEITLNLDPAQSKLNWTLGTTLHTVHGTFALKSGILRFNPASGGAGGEFIAYATSGESGNDSRDKKMHSEILESSRYPDIIFRPTKIDGKVALAGKSDVQLQGKILLHGGEHELMVPVQAELNGNHWKGTAKFSVPYIQWGLKSPNTFLLKADPTVQIELELSGTLQGAVAP
jgi:polyisoprenoid-binding protein YceI